MLLGKMGTKHKERKRRVKEVTIKREKNHGGELSNTRLKVGLIRVQNCDNPM